MILIEYILCQYPDGISMMMGIGRHGGGGNIVANSTDNKIGASKGLQNKWENKKA